MARSTETPVSRPEATLPVTPQEGLGVQLSGLPIQEITSTEQLAELRELVWRQKLVVLTGQEFENDEYVAFGHRLGHVRPYFQDNYHHPEHPEIFVSSNVPEEGQKVGVAGTGRMWHSDYSMFDDPLSMTMVAPRVIPEAKRKTMYIDMVRVLAEMPDELRTRLEGRRFFHEATWYYKIQPKDIDRAIAELIEEFRELSPGAWHPSILTHPVTGEQMLYASSGFTTKVEGMTYEEHNAYLKELFAYIEQERFIHEQDWRVGDILLWDNRPFIHHASTVRPGEQSCSYRISLNDGLPFYVGHTGASGLTS
ncbi:MAG: TauD/TfdA family dioxygenase [Planctomycetota bacterium]